MRTTKMVTCVLLAMATGGLAQAAIIFSTLNLDGSHAGWGYQLGDNGTGQAGFQSIAVGFRLASDFRVDSLDLGLISLAGTPTVLVEILKQPIAGVPSLSRLQQVRLDNLSTVPSTSVLASMVFAQPFRLVAGDYWLSVEGLTPADSLLWLANDRSMHRPLVALDTQHQFATAIVPNAITTAFQLNGDQTLVFTSNPEPGSFLLAGLGLATLLAFRRRRS